MNSPMCEESVRVGVVLATLSEDKGCVAIAENGRGVDFTSGKDEAVKSFLFDQVVTVDNVQGFHSELLQPLMESIHKGFNGAVLICGASTETMGSLIDRSVIKQIMINLFGRMSSPVKEDSFISVSLLQFYPDGSAVDVLSPNRQILKPVSHPVLGRLTGGVSEVCVSSAEEAYALYETHRETLKASPGSISSRCSFLFSVSVEWKLHPQEEESVVCRSRLQLFILAGGASRTDLRGVSPLVRILDQIPCEATNDDKLLPFLLKDALTGNSRTVLIYCIHPQGFLDNETPSALVLAQKVRSLVTKLTVVRWRPQATEQEIREKIMTLRTKMMSEGENEIHNTYKLAELIQDLQVVKNQSWEKRREEANKMKVKTKDYQLANNSGQLDTQIPDTVKHLQEQLKKEMEEHITDGKGDMRTVQERVGQIQQLRDALRDETVKHGAATVQRDISQQSQLEYNKAQERRRQLQEDHGRLIQEEVEKMERELAQEQLPTEGLQRELLVLTKERQVLVLQIEALRAEAQQAERDLDDQYHRHQAELHCLREDSLQVFRVFREVSEEQRKVSESRYRSVLLEAVQDAVYLSAQNQQLQADNKQLCKAVGELKDALAVRSDRKAEPLTQ